MLPARHLTALSSAVCAVALLVGAPPASAVERHWFTGRLLADSTAVFALDGVRPAAIRAAHARAGSYERSVPVASVRRAARRGELAVKVPPQEASRVRQQGSAVRLLVWTRRFPRFDGYSIAAGALNEVRATADARSAPLKATHDGSRRNSFQRVWYDVAWRPGSEVRYGVSLYIPDLSNWCWWNPVRWDNYQSRGSSGDVGGVRIEGGKLYLDAGRYHEKERVLVGPTQVPSGRWFRVVVRQRLSAVGGRAFSALYVDGKRIGSSRAPNSGGRTVNHIRFGNVSMASECSGAGSVYFRAVTASRTQIPSAPRARPSSDGSVAGLSSVWRLLRAPHPARPL